MACPAVTSGDRFLVEMLNHLDCQAQSLGSLGYASLAEPGSPGAFALAGLLTLFVAIFAYRLLFGPDPGVRDVVGAVLKIGIVLTLAASWPAYRILAYDTVLKGPAEIAASLASPQLPDTGSGFAERLQAIDTGLASLVVAGTGRQTGSLELEESRAGTFEGVALVDEQALGWARTAYLATTIGSLAVVRIVAGILLALAPLFAGLLLFAFTTGLFAGWLRGLVLAALGSVGLTVMLSIQAAVMEPWLAEVLQRRALGYATPSAPTEILALTLAFAVGAAGILFILAKVAFQNSWSLIPLLQAVKGQTADAGVDRESHLESRTLVHARPRAHLISESVTQMVERERSGGMPRLGYERLGSRSMDERSSSASASRLYRPEPLGSTYRRSARRVTSSQARRDGA